MELIRLRFKFKIFIMGNSMLKSILNSIWKKICFLCFLNGNKKKLKNKLLDLEQIDLKAFDNWPLIPIKTINIIALFITSHWLIMEL